MSSFYTFIWYTISINKNLVTLNTHVCVTKEKSKVYFLKIILETIINGETSRKQHLNEDLAMDLISEFIFCETNEEGKSTKVYTISI